MLYDLNTRLGAESARTRLAHLIERGVVVELTEKRPTRTLAQNSYLHVLLAYFASQTGNTLEWVKQQYYKRTCNPDLYIGEREDRLLGRVQYVRSSRELRTDEMSLSIDRFKNWAAENGIYLPDAEDNAAITEAQTEIERYKTYLYGAQ